MKNELPEHTYGRLNPMYIFNRLEQHILKGLFVPEKMLAARGTVLSEAILHPDVMDMLDTSGDVTYRDCLLADWRGNAADQSVRSILIQASVPTTRKHPHHIHEDGCAEDMPGRPGPFRTYFDGSYVEKPGHAVLIHVDKKEGLVTTQCPRGYDMTALGEEIIADVFAGYERRTVRDVQQTDVHSCVPYTLRNLFAAAGVLTYDPHPDIMDWRKTLMTRINGVSSMHQEIADFIQKEREQLQNDVVPIYRRPYIP